MIDWNSHIDKAESYLVHRLELLTPHLEELREILPKSTIQNWTDPFGRGYQYEFGLIMSNPSISLIVEISAVTNLAAAYFVRRMKHDDGSETDECSDVPFTSEHLSLRDRVGTALRDKGIQLIPYDELNVIRRGKPTYRWLFNDPEE